jgi:hypothetical protein
LPSEDEFRDSISKTQAGKEVLRTRKANEAAKQASKVEALLLMLHGARSVACFPLWDSHRERWFASGFA